MHAIIRTGNGKYYTSAIFGSYIDGIKRDWFKRYYIVLDESKTKLVVQPGFDPKKAPILDQLVLFFDEPSAGLDPISSHRLDELIMQMRDCLGATIIVVSHELASIFDIADRAIFLDAKTKRQLAIGNPHELLKNGPEDVKYFLNRGVV